MPASAKPKEITMGKIIDVREMEDEKVEGYKFNEFDAYVKMDQNRVIRYERPTYIESIPLCNSEDLPHLIKALELSAQMED